MDLVLTDIILTVRLMGAGGEAPQRLRKRDFAQKSEQSVCAAARETGNSDFPACETILPLYRRGKSVIDRPNAGWEVGTTCSARTI
jgi:hypothetical protein